MGNVKMQKVDLCVIQDNELAQVFLKTEKKPAVATVVVVDQTVPPNSPEVSGLHKALREKAEKELNIVKDDVRGSLHTYTVRETEESINNIFGSIETIFLEILPLSLEEIFISETEVAGYDIKKLILG